MPLVYQQLRDLAARRMRQKRGPEQALQAMALMDHPNIAKILDAGVIDTGRPYFLMETVKGVTITQLPGWERRGRRGRNLWQP